MKRVGGLCIVALVAAAAAAPASQAAWTPPAELAVAGQDASTPQVAVSNEGLAVFVWVRFDGTNPDPDPNVRCCNRIQARSSSGGVLGPVQTISAAGANAADPHVAVDPAGDAVIVFTRRSGGLDRITARARSATGVLGPTVTLSPTTQSTFEPQVAIDDSGDAVFAWTRYVAPDYQTATRALSSTGVLSGIQVLSQVGHDALSPRLDVDADGDGVFTWQRSENGANTRAQARARSAAGTLGPIENLSVAGGDVSLTPSAPDVKLDDAGDAVFVWTRQDGSSTGCCTIVQTRGRSAAGVMGPIADVSAAGRYADYQRLGVDADGDAVITYRRYDGANYRAVANGRSAAGVVSAPQTLSVAGAFAYEPAVAVAPAGNAVLSWARTDADGFKIVQARTRSAAGALSPISDVSLTGHHASALQVALDPLGDAIATWQRSDGTNTRIQASFGP